MSSPLRRRPGKFRPQLQRLEDRSVPAIFAVTNAADAGAGSLRDAIVQANALPGADVINFDPAFFNVPRTINLSNAPLNSLSITDSVTINGPAANLLTVRRVAGATNPFRVFTINRAAVSIDVSLSGMTILGGGLTGTGNAGRGAGVFVGNENVTLRNCVVSGNTTAGQDGAGIFVFAYGQLTLVNSTVSGNTTAPNFDGDGGGIAGSYYAEITLINSTVSGNAARQGGGIYLGPNGSLAVENSTISTNSASGQGGGVYFYGVPGPRGIAISNSTIAGNSAAAEGGGIAIRAANASVNNSISLVSSTITRNTARSAGGGSAAAGGGIAFLSGGGSIGLQSCVVAHNNDNGTTAAPDIFAAAPATNPVNASFSLVRNQAGANFPNYAIQNNLPAGTDPLFVGGSVPTLTNNGGVVQTVALQAASPLINAGSNPNALGADARGNGFPRTIESSADIGAYEFATVGGTPSARGKLPSGRFTDLTAGAIALNDHTFTFDVVYGGAVPIDGLTLGTGDITVTGPNGFSQVAAFVSAIVAGNTTTATYQIIAPGNYFDAADYGAYTVVANAGEVADVQARAVPAAPAGTFRILTPTTFTVGSTADSGAGTLRDAINQANARSDTADAIVFDPAVFSGAAAQQIVLTSGQLSVFDSLSITGPGANRLIVNGNNAGRVVRFVIPGIGSVNFSGLTITNGFADGDLTTNRGNGGGLMTSNETVILDGVSVTTNSTNRQGGGIAVGNSGSLTLRNCTVSGNTVIAGGVYSSGAGIYFLAGGRLLMENCTVSGNTAAGRGAGIYFYGAADSAVIRNSTITGNTAAVSGGGIGVYYLAGTFSIQNSTITRNTANGPLNDQGGGGIWQSFGTGTIVASSSVIALNANAVAPDVFGTLNSSNGLVGSATGATLPNYAAQGNLALGTNPLFVGGAIPTLANNGGPVATIALQAGSPLINAGANPAGLTTDARGGAFVRANGGVDIGALEVQTALPVRVASTTVNDGAVQRSVVTSLTVAFNNLVTFAGAPIGAFSLSRDGGGSVAFTLTLSSVDGATVATLGNFMGAETQFGSLADGRYTLTINSALVSGFAGNLDGDGNGTAGGLYAFGDAQGLFRLFGDINASRSIDISDFGPFSTSYNRAKGDPGYNPLFDFNGDNRIDIADFGQFSVRYFTSLP